MPDTGPRSPFSGRTRAEDGAIVTFTDGQCQRVVVRSGAPILRCIEEAIGVAERWLGEWKVAVISTPTTVYRDLQGSRDVLLDTQQHRVAAVPKRARAFATLEERMLGKIGRMDMLAS